jgi:hypothetical protein
MNTKHKTPKMPSFAPATISKAHVDARGKVKRAALVEINGTEVDRPPPIWGRCRFLLLDIDRR